MAIHLDPKSPAEVIDYRWEPELPDGDSIASFTLTVTGATKDSDEHHGDGITFFLSGGTAGNTAEAEATVVTVQGRTIGEMLYIPIRALGDQLGYNASQIVNFALRKIVGISRVPRAAEQADALERLGDMLAEWSGQGADLGVRLPVLASDTLHIPDAFAAAVKHNLLVRLADLYGEQVTPMEAMQAARGLQLVKANKLPDERGAVEYY